MTQSVELVTALPTTLACIVLRDWLTLKSVIALDTAYCCKAHRDNFLDLWRSDEYFIRQRVVISDNKPVCVVQKIGDKLRFLSFAVDDVAPERCSPIAKYCHQLTHVTLVCLNICTPETLDILRANRSLESVDIDIYHLEKSITVPPFTKISLPKLSAITLHGESLRSRHFLQAMKINKQLLRLKFSGCNIKRAVLLQIPVLCPNLKCLDLSVTRLTDVALSTLTASCSHIVHLDFASNYQLTDVGISNVTQNLKWLRTLNIEDAPFLTDVSLWHIQTHCAKALSALYIGSLKPHGSSIFSHEAVNELLEHCIRLRTFSWREAWRHIADTYMLSAAAVRHLTTLYLFRHNLYTQSLTPIGAFAHNLTTLSIWCCHTYPGDDATLRNMFDSIFNGCPKLRHLYVYRESMAFPDSLLDEFCKRRPSVEVEIQSCENSRCVVMDIPI